MVLISGYALVDLVLVLVATYVLWLNILILDAILYVRGEGSSLKNQYERKGVYGAIILFTLLGWVVLTGLFWLPVRVGVAFVVLGGLLMVAGKKVYVLVGSLSVSMFEPRKKSVEKEELLEDVTIGIKGGINGREGL